MTEIAEAHIHVNAPTATDADGIASEMTASLERSTWRRWREADRYSQWEGKI